MSLVKTSIGLDFGTLEARAQLRTLDGALLAESAFRYPHGVITGCLSDGTPLPDGAALQHPQDYIDAIDALIPALFQDGADPGNVLGIGVDFTQCTMMPVGSDGTPLCFDARFASEPMAYAKLWRHHSAQAQADRLTQVARDRGESFLNFSGGIIYAELMFPKILETYERAPEVYESADRFVELADWVPQYLTGAQRRSSSIAGCASMWDPQTGYPEAAFFDAASPGFSSVLHKMRGELVPVGQPIGRLRSDMARRLGLPAGIPVAAGLGDCQAAFLGAGLSEPGVLLSVMGTSSCDMLIDPMRRPIPGMYGVSCDSMIPGFYGYEAGQATMGDLFGWFSHHWVPAAYEQAAKDAGLSIFDYLNRRVEGRDPASSGLLALDWWSGNRTVLLNTDLSGLLVGMTTQTQCEDVYLALVQALSFGKRRIVEQFNQYGVPIDKLCVTGGVAEKNPFLMQTFADVIGIPVETSQVENGSCTGSCVYGALAGGGYSDFGEAARRMGSNIGRVYEPNETRRQTYNTLYALYLQLHDYFGLQSPLMKQLRELRARGEQG